MKWFLVCFAFIFLSLRAMATDLQITLPFFNASPASNRTVSIQAMTPFVGNLIYQTGVGTNQVLVFSNAPIGLLNGVIQAPPAKINFQVYLTSSALGLLDASNCLSTGTAATYPAGATAWTIATSDNRYQLSGTTFSNTFNPNQYIGGANTTLTTNGNVVTIAATGGGGTSGGNVVLFAGAHTTISSNAAGVFTNYTIAADAQTNVFTPTNDTTWFDSKDAALNATNNIGPASHLSAFQATNFFDLAGAGTTAANGATNVLWASALANLYPTSNPSAFVSANVTNGLVGAGITNGFAVYTNPAPFMVSNSAALFVFSNAFPQSSSPDTKFYLGGANFIDVAGGGSTENVVWQFRSGSIFNAGRTGGLNILGSLGFGLTIANDGSLGGNGVNFTNIQAANLVGSVPSAANVLTATNLSGFALTQVTNIAYSQATNQGAQNTNFSLVIGAALTNDVMTYSNTANNNLTTASNVLQAQINTGGGNATNAIPLLNGVGTNIQIIQNLTATNITVRNFVGSDQGSIQIGANGSNIKSGVQSSATIMGGYIGSGQFNVIMASDGISGIGGGIINNSVSIGAIGGTNAASYSITLGPKITNYFPETLTFNTTAGFHGPGTNSMVALFAPNGVAINTNLAGTNSLKVSGNVDASSFTINQQPLVSGLGFLLASNGTAYTINVYSNLNLGADPVYSLGTNYVGVMGEGEGTYQWTAVGQMTNLNRSGWSLNLSAGTWFIRSNTVSIWSSAAGPSTNIWTVVASSGPSPVSFYGPTNLQTGTVMNGYVTSSNITAQIIYGLTNPPLGLTINGNAATATIATNAASGGNIATITNIPGRVFYVATNGNDITAKLNDRNFPWASPVNASNLVVFSLATNFGDTVFFLNGSYLITNIATARGIKVIGESREGTFFQGMSVLGYPTFSPGSYSEFENFTWVTNAQNAGFLFNDPVAISVSNSVFRNITMHGGIDVIHNGPVGNSIYPAAIFFNCYADCPWDIVSGGVGSGIITIGCTFNALNNYQGNASRMATGGMLINDYGSVFIGFSNATTIDPHSFNQYFHPHGSIFVNSASNLFPLAITEGTYYNQNSNQWYMAGTLYRPVVDSTNYTYTYDPTNLLIVLATNGAWNSHYVLSNAYNASVGARMTWTNVAGGTTNIQWNNPAVIANGGQDDVLSIFVGSVAQQTWFRSAGGQPFSAAVIQGDPQWYDEPSYSGIQTTLAYFYTNSITTNIVYVPRMVQTNAGDLIVTGDLSINGTVSGNAYGLTNYLYPSNTWALTVTNGMPNFSFKLVNSNGAALWNVGFSNGISSFKLLSP